MTTSAPAGGRADAEYGVLGGGFCGLLIGNELARRRVSFRVLERDGEPGGLARSVDFGGALGDRGPHALYSANKKVLAFFRSLPIRYKTHHRKVRIVHHGKDGRIHEVGYPFENGLGDLPLEDRVDCLVGYVDAFTRGRRPPANLKDWIDNSLGSGIARHFMTPYNRKIWNAPLHRISMGLVKNKIEPAPLESVVQSAMGVRTVGRKVQAVFLYPRGGIGEVARALAETISSRIMLQAPAVSIRKDGPLYAVRTPRGVFRFPRLISTMPLKDFLAIQPYGALRKHRGALAGNDTYFVSVELAKGRRFARFADCHWLFFAGPEIFYRVSMTHVFRGKGGQHLVAEITRKGPARKMSLRQLQARTVGDLGRAGILGARARVKRVTCRVVEHAYPIPTVGLPKIQQRVETALARKGIHIIGRSGRWDYSNMDQIVEKVWEFFKTTCPKA